MPIVHGKDGKFTSGGGKSISKHPVLNGVAKQSPKAQALAKALSHLAKIEKAHKEHRTADRHKSAIALAQARAAVARLKGGK